MGVVTGYSLSRKIVLKSKLSEKVFDRVCLVILLMALLGARTYHVLDLREYYANYPLNIFAIWNGGLAIYGALIGGFLGLFLYLVKTKHLNQILKWCDVLAPGILVAQVIGRWGNYVNSEAIGPPTSLPWSVYIDKDLRPSRYISSSNFHPLFLYESIWNLIGLFIIMRCSRWFKFTGRTFSFYLIWYGLGRFVYEFGRSDTALFLNIKVAQIISVVMVIMGILLLWKIKKNVGKLTQV